jgi:hypothetical protein
MFHLVKAVTRQDGNDNLCVAYYENEAGTQAQVTSFDRAILTGEPLVARALFNARVTRYYLRKGAKPPACCLLGT